jgi:hypothetical protein
MVCFSCGLPTFLFVLYLSACQKVVLPQFPRRICAHVGHGSGSSLRCPRTDRFLFVRLGVLPNERALYHSPCRPARVPNLGDCHNLLSTRQGSVTKGTVLRPLPAREGTDASGTCHTLLSARQGTVTNVYSVVICPSFRSCRDTFTTFCPWHRGELITLSSDPSSCPSYNQ